eukprot:UN10675
MPNDNASAPPMKPMKSKSKSKSKSGGGSNVGSDVWNGYIKKFGSPPASASQLQNYSKTSEFNSLNFKQAREAFN